MESGTAAASGATAAPLLAREERMADDAVVALAPPVGAAAATGAASPPAGASPFFERAVRTPGAADAAGVEEGAEAGAGAGAGGAEDDASEGEASPFFARAGREAGAAGAPWLCAGLAAGGAPATPSLGRPLALRSRRGSGAAAISAAASDIFQLSMMAFEASMITAAASSVPGCGVRLAYGTAGFRADAKLLDSIVLRMGMLAALRSASHGGQVRRKRSF